MLLNGQSNVSPQRGMPVDDKGASSSIITFTEPAAIQLYYYNGAVRTTDAGQAAGTAVVGQLTYDNIKNVSGAYQASKNDTSLAFTCTAMTSEVAWKPEWAGMDASTEKDKLNGIVADFTNGQYTIDYSTGAIYGKKATTASTMTSVSYKIKQNRAGDTAGGGGGGGSASGGGLAIYYAKPSNGDAVSAYASGTTLTVTGLSFTFTALDIVSIDQYTSANVYVGTYTGKTHTITVSGTTITVASASFSSGDLFIVTLSGPDKAYDKTNNTGVTSLINTSYNRNTDALPLISSALTLTNSFADVGGEIATRGYKYIYYYVTVDINNSNDVRLKFLGKHTAGGSEEYVLDHALINAPDTALSATDDYIELATDADQLIIVRVPIDNTLPYIQMQASVGTAGATAADLDAVRFSFGY